MSGARWDSFETSRRSRPILMLPWQARALVWVYGENHSQLPDIYTSASRLRDTAWGSLLCGSRPLGKRRQNRIQGSLPAFPRTRITPSSPNTIGIGSMAQRFCHTYSLAPIGADRQPGASVWPLHHRDRDLRRILLRVVHGVVRDDAFRLVVVVAAGVQVAIEAREVAARHLDAQPWPAAK